MCESIIESFKKADQEQLFKYYESLSKDEQSSFVSQLSKINDPSGLVSTVQDAIEFSSSSVSSKNYTQLPLECCASTWKPKRKLKRNVKVRLKRYRKQ